MATERILVAPPGPILPTKLHLEAAAQWANFRSLSDPGGGQISFSFDAPAPAQATVQALINAHDPAPLPLTAAELAFNADRQLVRDYVVDASLDAFLVNAAPSAAAQLAALKGTIRAVRALARATKYAVKQLE